MRAIVLVVILVWLMALSQRVYGTPVPVLVPAREPARSCVLVGEWRVCWEPARQ